MIDSKSSFPLWSEVLNQNRREMDLVKLQFFHVWIFYYLQSADHKFIKAILKHKFPFSSELFGKEIARLNKKTKNKDVIRKVYGDKTVNLMEK
jgi:hypothetical protein